MLLLLLIGLGWWLWTSYNKLVVHNELCNAAYANIDTELTRKFNLYLKATSVLENGSDFEKGVFVKVTELRTRSDLSISEKVEQANNLLAVAENNPNVNSVQLYSTMQRAVDSTESRLQEARQNFNTAVNNYNMLLSQIPMCWAAKILKFKRRDYFEHDSTKTVD